MSSSVLRPAFLLLGLSSAASFFVAAMHGRSRDFIEAPSLTVLSGLVLLLATGIFALAARLVLNGGIGARRVTIFGSWVCCILLAAIMLARAKI